jgi:O-succinylbenzoic acid--CoA ligase
VLDRFTPEAFAAAAARLDPAARRYTALVPTQLHRLLDAGVRLDAFDAILLGGAAAPTALLLRATRAGTRIVRTYGMTETCGGCVYDGRPLPGVLVDLVDGRIRIGGPVLARGYLDPPGGDGFADGRFLTSDTGRLDGAATGAITVSVLGRADEVIVTGGSNVAAQGVEAELAEHPGVAAVAVAGRPDAEWGEIVVALVVPRGDRPDPAELRAHVGDRLGWPYAPREVVFATELPLLGSGKVDRAAVRRLVAAAPRA